MRIDLPFSRDEYDMPMNVRPVEPSQIIGIDARYRAELAQKRTILAENPSYYLQALPGTEALQWEALEYLLALMAAQHPRHFALTARDTRLHWRNRLLALDAEIRPDRCESLGDLHGLAGVRVPPGTEPLTWLGMQVQEDLILMDGATPGAPLVAGHLCFGAGWALGDKIGKPFLAVHREVPQFAARIGQAADAMMARLKVGRPVGRMNWSLATTDRLNLAPSTTHQWLHTRRGITMQNAGDRLWIRTEWQTLSRLPRSGGILFTIRTALTPLRDLTGDRDRLRHFTGMVKGMPRATREYKGMAGYMDELVDYLEARTREAQGLPPTTAARRRGPERQGGEDPGPAMLRRGEGTWEPWPLAAWQVLEGEPRARVRWLRRNVEDEPFYQAGEIEMHPSRTRWTIAGNETSRILSGRATVTCGEDRHWTLEPGDSISFDPNTVVEWTVLETLRRSFVASM